MKRLSHSLLLVAAFVAAAPARATVQVVTSLQDFASIADAVGGKRVETFALAKGYQDPHFVEPKPSFVLKLSKADLLIVAGLELEIGYLPPLIDQSRNDKIRPGGPGYLDASTGCDILERPTGTVTRAMGDVHPFGNPHYWLDPENGRDHRARDRRAADGARPRRRRRVRRQPRRLRGEAHRGREALGRGARRPTPAPRSSRTTTPGRTSSSASSSSPPATSSPSPASRPRRRTPSSSST